MANHPIQIRCPGCGCLKAVSLAVGQQLQCHVCRTVFFAPILAADALMPEGRPQDGTPEDMLVGTDGGPVAPEHAPDRHDTDTADFADQWAADSSSRLAEDAEASPAAASPPPPAAATGGAWRPANVAAAPPAAGTAAERAAPASRPVRGQLPPAATTPVGGDPARWWAWLAPLVTVLLLVACVSCALYLLRWFAGADRANRPFDGPRVEAPAGSRPVPPAWSDAARHSLRLGTLVIRVMGVQHGPIRARDANHQLITTDDDNLLAVQLKIENRGREACRFTSWYGQAFDTDAGEQVAELMDDQQRDYALLKFEDVTRVEGQRFTDRVEPRQSVRDTVVFVVPDGVDVRSLESLFLVLPGAAVQARGACYFQIPARMIRDVRADEAAAAAAISADDEEAADDKDARDRQPAKDAQETKAPKDTKKDEKQDEKKPDSP